MFNPNAEPVGHEPPYRRIGINDPVPTSRAANPMLQEVEDAIQWGKNRHVWQAVVDTASGTNMTSSPSSTSSPTDCEHTVCIDGLEDA